MDINSNQVGVITDVGQSTRQYLWQYHRGQVIGVGVATLTGAILLVLFFHDLSAAAFPIALVLLWFGRVRAEVESRFLRQFATANGFGYAQKQPPARAAGRVFGLGDSRSSHDVVSGQLGGLPFELFLYQYSTGSGRSRQEHKLTVVAVQLGQLVPNIYANCLESGRSSVLSFNLNLPLGGTHLKFNNEFDNYYRLDIDQGEEVEALQIFEPDLLAFLIDQPVHFDFELLDDTLYLYAPKAVSTKDELDGLFAYSQAISGRIKREVKTMHVSPEVAAVGNAG